MPASTPTHILGRRSRQDREEARGSAEQAKAERRQARRPEASDMAEGEGDMQTEGSRQRVIHTRVARSRPATALTRPVRELDIGSNPKFAKFVDLVNIRMPKALSELENIKFLASKERYDYAPEHHEKIVNRLRRAVDEIDKAFAEAGRRKPRQMFSLLDC
jgi:hypothetical protein